MTIFEIIGACVGFLLCAGIFTVVCLLIMLVIWWTFKTDINVEINVNEWEEER